MISTKKPLIFGIVLKNWLDVHNCLNFKSSFFYPVRAGLENQWLNITRSDLISGNDKDRRAEAQYLFTEDYLSVICGNAPANLHWGADANGLLGGHSVY